MVLNIEEKNKPSLLVFDIVQLEPLISELPRRPLKSGVHSHSKKETLLFDKKEFWVSRGDSPMFDVAMGCYDGADVCNLVGLISYINSHQHTHTEASVCRGKRGWWL